MKIGISVWNAKRLLRDTRGYGHFRLLKAALLLALTCAYGLAPATTLMPRLCGKNGRIVDCPPNDPRPPAIGKHVKRRLLNKLEQRMWFGTVIDMRNDWYRVVFEPTWDEYLITEVKYCVVPVHEYTEGLGRPAESTRFYYLRIDKEDCQKDKLFKLAQSYVPFEAYKTQRTICDSMDIQDCMSAAVWLIGELAARYEADPSAPRDVLFFGPSGMGSVPEWMSNELKKMIKSPQLPEIFVQENKLLNSAFCARYGTVALICSTGNGRVTINIFALNRY